MHGSGVPSADASSVVSLSENNEGGVVTCGMLPDGWGVPRDDEGRKHQRQRCLPSYVVKAVVTVTAIVVAVILIITHQEGDGMWRGATLSPNVVDKDGTASLVPRSNSRGRLRSEGLHSLKGREQLAAASVSASSLIPTSRSRALGNAAATGGNSDGSATAGSEKRARIGYLIMTSGVEELHKTKRLLQAIYDPNNFYLVHVDRKDNHAIRVDIENFIKDWDNVRMLEPALDVSWGGYTVTLTAIFGICNMVQWSDEWDFFINLSASDFPLLPQSELTAVLGKYADVGMNFLSGEPLNERNRVEVFIDDQGLYREQQSSKAGKPLKVGKPRLPPSKSMFTVYKGEFWVILHRSVCQYIEASPDNVARSLQAYFSRFRISDESYFQTVLCHPLAPSFRVHPDNLRFVSWPSVSEGHYVLHPDPITSGNVNVAIESGALFARKFDSEVSQPAYITLEKSLGESTPGRIERALSRLAPANWVTGRQRFCAIPEGYSIQEVLSHPPKKAMRLPQDQGKGKGQSQPKVQARDARAKDGHNKP